MQKNVNQEILDLINLSLDEPEERENFMDNLVSYTYVLSQGKFKMVSYINAVKYVSFKVAGLNNKESYKRTFPEKYVDFHARGVASKDIASYITAYNKSKLVQLIYAQTLTPCYIINQPLFQRALNVQAALMLDTSISPKVRSDAANSILTHTKAPETQKVELDVNVAEDKSISDLRAATNELVEKQKELIAMGTPVIAIAHSQIIDSPESTVEDA